MLPHNLRHFISAGETGEKGDHGDKGKISI
jgi:hypothetical protein